MKSKECIIEQYTESEYATHTGVKLLHHLLDNYDLTDFVKLEPRKLGKELGIAYSKVACNLSGLVFVEILVRDSLYGRYNRYMLNPKFVDE